MIYTIEDTMPHVHIFSCWKSLQANNLNAIRVHTAYEDISTAHNNIDYLRIFSRICGGTYSPEEVMAAGVIITDALDGYFLNKGKGQEAKYLRINGIDIIFLTKDRRIHTGKDINGAEFYENNRKLYSLKTIATKKRIDCANSQPSKDE